MSDTTWSRYVRRTSGNASGSEIEKKTGIGQSTVSRWFSGTVPTPAHAAKFAQSYGGNVLEAFVAAGFLTPDEAGVPPRAEIDFYTLVDEDSGLSAQAKVHLKNQYGLLRAASAHARTVQVRELIEAEAGIDEDTRARLLAAFTDADNPGTNPGNPVIEHPFLQGAFVRETVARPLQDVDVIGVGAIGSEVSERFSERVRSYAAALLSETEERPEAAEALNERLLEQGRIDTELGGKARVFISYAAGSGKTAAFLAALAGQVQEQYDLALTDDDREFLAGIGVAHDESTVLTAHHHRPKAARTAQSKGRIGRRLQDEAAESGQDDEPEIVTDTDEEIIDPSGPPRP